MSDTLPSPVYQAVVINCVHKQLCSEIIAGRNRPKSALRSSRTRRSGWDGQEESLVSNSSPKDDPSDPVYGPKRTSKARRPEGLGGPLEISPAQPSRASRCYQKRPPGKRRAPRGEAATRSPRSHSGSPLWLRGASRCPPDFSEKIWASLDP